MGVREAPRPFHLVTQGFLPHFQESAAKPCLADRAGAELGPLFSGSPEGAVKSDESAAESARAGVRAGRADSAAALERGGARGGTTSSSRSSAGLWREPAQLLRRLLWSGSLGFKARPRRLRREAQGELSLASIRVKRNDLVEADIELVRVPAAVRTDRRASRPTVAEPGPRLGRGGDQTASAREGAARLAFWRRWFRGRVPVAQ